MKILWITNTIFPAACKELNIPTPVVGGWMYSSANYLLETFNEISLGVASLYNGNSVKRIVIKNITYFLVPQSSNKHIYDKKLEIHWKHIKAQFNPDITHIHGTEYPHSLSYINACGSKNVVVSVQGLVSIIERYYFGGIDAKILRKNITLRDIAKRDSVFNQRFRMRKRGLYEKSLIKKVDHVIGRTSWDKVHIWAINPKANYHFCNETLRSTFYKKKWERTSCIKHQIFLSQSGYPLKGFQQVIKALPLILKHFPNVKIHVAGNDFFNTKKRYLLNGFGKYIRSLTNSLEVTDKIVFTGALSENEMCNKFLESHVFISPSSIENSSNSIGEAQLLGIPCIASFVGGGSDLITHEETGLLYRFEEIEMLAESVCRIFRDDELVSHISANGRQEAMKRHSKSTNVNQLNSIYKSICGN